MLLEHLWHAGGMTKCGEAGSPTAVGGNFTTAPIGISVAPSGLGAVFQYELDRHRAHCVVSRGCAARSPQPGGPLRAHRLPPRTMCFEGHRSSSRRTTSFQDVATNPCDGAAGDGVT